VEATRTIANLRSHVEREMERRKNFRVLTRVVPITMASHAAKIWKICVRTYKPLPYSCLKGQGIIVNTDVVRVTRCKWIICFGYVIKVLWLSIYFIILC